MNYRKLKVNNLINHISVFSMGYLKLIINFWQSETTYIFYIGDY